MNNESLTADELIDELRESEERFRTICQNAPVMIDQFDAAGRCKLWNRECEKQLGYTRAEIEACEDPLALFYPDPQQRNRVLEAIRRADGTFREYRVRPKNGRERVQLWADFRLPNGAQISVGHDVTEQRATEEQLRQSQKMEALGQLTGGMAHDFNNLLTVVLANAEMLQRSSKLDAAGKRATGEIVAATKRGATLIRKLLAFSRSDVIEVVPVDANALVNELAPTLARLLPASIRVRVQTEPSLPRIEADQGAIEQMLLNLVTNARDAMPDGGTLMIGVEGLWVDAAGARLHDCEPGEYVSISVRDDGAGMDATTRRRIFEPFFTTKAGDGTGLGMPMVYGLTKQQAGAVIVTSEVGVGTVVQLLFPVARRSALPASPGRDPGAKRILVVEDQAPIRDVTRAMLLEAGFVVDDAPDGGRAYALLSGDRDYDLVLCDVVMPGMGGAELQAATAELPNAPPFLFVTGYATEDVLARLGQDEALHILRKPYTTEQLLGAVSDILGTRLRVVGQS